MNEARGEISVAVVPSALALAISSVLSVGVWYYDSGPVHVHRAVTAAIAVVSLATLFSTFGLQYRSGRRALLMRTTSLLFAFAGIAVLLLLAFLDARPIACVLAAATTLLLMTAALFSVFHMAEPSRPPTTR